MIQLVGIIRLFYMKDKKLHILFIGDIMNEKGKSLWIDTVEFPSFSALNKDIKTDIVVVGGGICGILCAYYLMKEGNKVIVVEKNKIGMGITKNTTAVITAQHDILYSTRIKKDGFEKAQQYLDANLMALKEYANLSKEFDFDFEEKDSYIYSTIDETILTEEVEALNKLGIHAELVNKIALPFSIRAAVKFPKQAQMNALKLIKCLIKEMEIYENTNVIDIKKNVVYTDHHKIEAKAIIVTTHYPFIDRLGMYYTKMFQNRSYVIAIKNDEDIGGTYTNLETTGFYFRKYKEYLLIGGNDHKTANGEYHYENLISFVNNYYPNAKIEYMWANQDCITLDDIPYIGKYSNFSESLYVATGFNLWGMTQSMISALILRDLVMNRRNVYQKLYRPNRNIFKKQLFINLGSYLKNLLNFRTKRCPHLGCALVWNDEEQTWDCPCHGSRFTKKGKLIDNPSNKDLN